MITFENNYFTTALFLTVYIFVFTFHLPHRKNYWIRAGAVGGSLLVMAAIFQMSSGNTVRYYLYYVFILWIYHICGCAICYKEKPILYIFWSLTGNATLGVVGSAFRTVAYYGGFTGIPRVLVWLALYVATGLGVYILMVEKLKKRNAGNMRFRNYVFYMIVALLLLMFLAYDMRTHTTISEGEYLIFRMMLSLLGVCMLYIFSVEYDLYDNYHKLHELLEKDKIRYEVSKEYTDIINMKCHDLKHQLWQMQRQEHVDETYIKELEEAIRIYDTDIKTGNEALDIILTEKNRICAAEKIEATFIVDGSIIAFMRPTDLYSLFGNILDNAIEAVRELPDEDMRQISVVLAQETGIIRIRQQNYYRNQMQMTEDELISTTKEDKENHGYGLKSIRYVAEKYGGVMTLETDENIFILNILIPYAGKEM